MNRSMRVFLTAALVLGSVAIGGIRESHAATVSSSKVTIDAGVLQGTITDGVTAFLGIPYAAPPVGDLRWRAPQPVARWKGVRAADAYGHDCMQNHLPEIPGVQQPVSEDCLTLNVWAPAHVKGKLPVMFWIHGGGFNIGAGSWIIYNGTEFAKRGVVLVTINYRLGKFGFFAHPALTTENPAGPLGNYGIMDQIAALKWVNRNISRFGGDAKNITIFGESAGGGSVNALMVAPETEGLFTKAIVESGGGGASLNGGRTLKTAEEEGAKAMAELGVTTDNPSALRAISAEKVLGNASMASGGGPMVDGRMLTADFRTAFENGKQHKLPYLVGANSWEGGLFGMIPTLGAIWDGISPAMKEKLMTVYDGYGTHEEKRIREQFIGDAVMVAPARAMARAVARSGSQAYLYHFSYVPPKRSATDPGANHGSEISFVFNTLSAMDFSAPQDAKIANTMQNLWVQFARTGKPGDAWPPYSEKDDKLMEFGKDGAVVREHFAERRMELLDTMARGQAALPK